MSLWVWVVIAVGIAVAVPCIIYSVRRRRFYSSVEYVRYSGVMKSFERKMNFLLGNDELILESGLNALQHQVDAAYNYLSNAKFPPLDDIVNALNIYKRLPDLIANHDKEKYYSGAKYIYSSNEMKLFEREGRSLLRGSELMQSGVDAFHFKFKSVYQYLIGAGMPPLDDVGTALVLYEKFPELITKHNKEINFANQFENRLQGLLSRDKYIAHSEQMAFREEFERCPVLISHNGYRDKFLTEAVERSLEEWKSLSVSVNQHNKTFVDRELMRCSNFFDSCMGYVLDDQQRRACVVDDDVALVIAGAGSGKTSTMAAKVAYLIQHRNVLPSEVLLISFTNKAAEEMGARIRRLINEDIDTFTFHKLGLKIIKDFGTIGRFDIADDDLLESIVHKFVSGEERVVPDATYKTVAEYFAYFFSPAVPSRGTVPLPEYVQKSKSLDFRTLRSCTLYSLRAEKVKSQEEVIIANYLYLNGVEYEYEASYPKEYTDDGKHRHYHPDFYLPEYDVYIEHYGLDARGNPPPFFTECEKRRYVEAFKWKRNLHKNHGNKYVETFSYQVHDGTLFNHLNTELKKQGVSFRPRDSREVMQLITRNLTERVSEFERLIASFITLFKANNFHVSQFDEFLNCNCQAYDKTRLQNFLVMAKNIYELYQRRLKESKKIDFSDMINEATRIVSSHEERLPWKYVIVDEYQDVSVSRAKMIKAILENSKAHLFCVGDDWQSIYRFAGSDVSLFVKFGDFFGVHMEMYLERTYRNSQELIDIMGAFIQKNPMQKRKCLKSSHRNSLPVLSITYPCGNACNAYGKALVHTIRDIAKKTHSGQGSVMLLGRTKYDERLIMEARGDDGQPILRPKGRGTYECLKYPKLRFRFLTVHKAKGLEDDYVVILNCKNDKLGFPNQIVDDPILNVVLSEPETYPYAEERRLFYVAVTRTRNSTYLIVPEGKESPFAVEMAEAAKHGIVKLDGCRTNNAGKCPDCHSGTLVEKTGQYGSFKYCSNYPICVYTSNARSAKNGEKTCPRCGNAMVIRTRESDGHKFWGCTNYPSCKQTEDVDCSNTLRYHGYNRTGSRRRRKY